jgi:hypothetical protein
MSALELSIDELKNSINELKNSIDKLKNTPSNAEFDDNFENLSYNDKDKLYIDDTDKLNAEIDIDLYSEIIIVLEIEIIETKEKKETKFSFTMTDEFKEAFKNNKIETLKVLFFNLINKKYYKNISILKVLGKYHSKINYVKGFKLANITETSATGGKKRVVKQTVKELQAIAVENNIKITKKVEGKTVRLNKKGLIAKLKRYKLI